MKLINIATIFLNMLIYIFLNLVLSYYSSKIIQFYCIKKNIENRKYLDTLNGIRQLC